MTKAEKPAARSLSYTDPGTPFTIEQVPQIYCVLRDVLNIDDDPKKFQDVALNSGTHILKLLNKQADDHVLKLSAPGQNRRPKFLPSMNAANGKYSKILFQPIAVIGVPGSRSLVEHILEPDGISSGIEDSFVSAFSRESLDAIRSLIREERRSVERLYAQNFPIVYVPAPGGGDLQLTPIAPLEVYGAFSRETLPEKGEKVPVRLTEQALSSKMQNISVAIGGPRRRFLVTVPSAMRHDEAALLRLVKGGPGPAPSSRELSDRLDHLAKLHHAKLEHAKSGSHYNRDMEKGLERLAAWLIEEALEWREDVAAAAREMAPDFVMPEADIGQLLLRGYLGDRSARDRVMVALRDRSFRKVLEGKLN